MMVGHDVPVRAIRKRADGNRDNQERHKLRAGNTFLLGIVGSRRGAKKYLRSAGRLNSRSSATETEQVRHRSPNLRPRKLIAWTASSHSKYSMQLRGHTGNRARGIRKHVIQSFPLQLKRFLLRLPGTTVSQPLVQRVPGGLPHDQNRLRTHLCFGISWRIDKRERYGERILDER